MAITGALRTRVRVHVVAGNDVDAHIGCWTANFVALAPRHRHRRLAAAVMKEVNVRITEMTVADAVDDIVETGFDEANPGGRVECALVDRAGRVVRQHDDERQPQHHEYDEAVEVGAGQRQVPGVVEAGLEVGQAHEALHVERDAQMDVEGDDDGQRDQQQDDGQLVRGQTDPLPVAKVKAHVERVLDAGHNDRHEPHGQQYDRGVAAIEPVGRVLRCAQSQIVFE